jgi:hypothetical protein
VVVFAAAPASPKEISGGHGACDPAAGTFDTFTVELTTADGGSDKETVGIAKYR